MFAQMSFSEQRVAGCETFLQAGSFPAEELKIDLCKCTRMASGISFRKNSKRLLVSYNWLFLSTLSQLDRVLMRKTAFKDGPVSWEWWWQRHSCRSLLHSSLTHTHTHKPWSVRDTSVSCSHASLISFFSVNRDACRAIKHQQNAKILSDSNEWVEETVCSYSAGSF